jgi:hypothetical protein
MAAMDHIGSVSVIDSRSKLEFHLNDIHVARIQNYNTMPILLNKESVMKV